MKTAGLRKSSTNLPFSELMRQSSDLFSAIITTDPKELYKQHGFNSGNIAITSAERMLGENDLDPAVRELARLGIRDTASAIQGVFVETNLTAPIKERLEVATDIRTAYTLGILAARNEDAMQAAIGDYPGGRSRLRLSFDRSHITTDMRAAAGCPFASGELRPRPAPIFTNFAQWAGELAVYLDDPSYRRRHGESA